MTVKELRALLFEIEDQDQEVQLRIRTVEENGRSYNVYAPLDNVYGVTLGGTDDTLNK